jgi:hypothetical protein
LALLGVVGTTDKLSTEINAKIKEPNKRKKVFTQKGVQMKKAPKVAVEDADEEPVLGSVSSKGSKLDDMSKEQLLAFIKSSGQLQSLSTLETIPTVPEAVMAPAIVPPLVAVMHQPQMVSQHPQGYSMMVPNQQQYWNTPWQ